MRRPIACLLAGLMLVGPATAQTRFAEPRAEHTVVPKEALSTSEAKTSTAAAHEQSRAQMDKFDRRITDRGNRAMRTVCVGCTSTGAKPNKISRRVEANAETLEMPIKDPAAAPTD